MSDLNSFSAPLKPDDALPPIEPPSMKFIVQLFVIPAVIVGCIVLVWLGLNLLTRGADDPKTFVAQLQRNNETRWHAASNLCMALRAEKNVALRRDPELVSTLMKLLTDDLSSGKSNDEAVNTRIYICQALGEFELATPFSALLAALNTNRDKDDQPVREAAVQAIAKLTYHLRTAAELDNREVPTAELTKSLIAVTQEEGNNVLRSQASYALGYLGGVDAVKRLSQLLDDSYPDTRYNAAVGLARHGDAQGSEVLLEMLSANPAGVALEKKEQQALKDYKRRLIQANAMRAVVELHRHSPMTDMQPYIAAIEKLLPSFDSTEKREAEKFIAALKAAPPSVEKP